MKSKTRLSRTNRVKRKENPKKKKRYKKQKNDKTTKQVEEILSETDRLTYIYKQNKKREIIEATNVSYELLIKSKWYTVTRFDDKHGYLHQHTLLSTKSQIDIAEPNTDQVIKKGSHKKWLGWAIKHIRNNFWRYRQAFLRRSEITEY